MRNALLMAGILVASLATGCESSEETNKRQVAACGQNLQCLSKLSEPTAHVFCKRPIERLTQYDMKWDEFGFADTRFSKITWKDMNHGIITYVGDRAKIQTPEGAYINVIYACDIDPADTNSPVKDVWIVGPGKL